MKKYFHLFFLILSAFGCSQYEIESVISNSEITGLKSAVVGGITLPYDSVISAPYSWFLSTDRELRFQADGNLVIYQGGSPVWASGTDGKYGAKLAFQSDGNLVIYHASAVVWQSGTHSYGKVFKFAEPGSLTVEDQFGTVVWRSHNESISTIGFMEKGVRYSVGTAWTHPESGLYVYFQPDGNLVIYEDNTCANPVWASNTNGTLAKLVWQSDGNLVMYDGNNNPKWHSNTAGRGYELKFHEEGLMILDANGRNIWKTFFTSIPTTDPFNVQLAKRWAPIVVQWVETSGSRGLDGVGDFITSATYDNDWNGRNNWENLYAFSSNLKGKIYYSILETSTHYFIFYGFFHPRDWVFVNLGDLDCHENDLEGTLHIIRKTEAGPYGRFEAAVTVSHSDFYSWTAREIPGKIYEDLDIASWQKDNPTYVSGLTANEESIDGPVYVVQYHDQKYARPLISSSAMSHAVKAFPHKELFQTAAVIYRPSLIPEEKPLVPYFPDRNPSGEFRLNAYYELEDIFAPTGLMSQIDNMNFYAEANRFAFAGDTYGPNSASCPWSLNDSDDSLPYGYLVTHSGLLTVRYFGNLGAFGRQYVGGNPYDQILTVYQQQPGYIPDATW